MDINFWEPKSNTWIRTQSKRPFFHVPDQPAYDKTYALSFFLKLYTLMEGKVARIASKMTHFSD